MIHIHDLSKTYNGVTVLKIDELHIPKGESFGLVGNNGAGKTTLFSALLDLIQPTTGYIQNGEAKVNESEAWKSHTASFIDESFLIGYLTAEEYFYFIGELCLSPSLWEGLREGILVFLFVSGYGFILFGFINANDFFEHKISKCKPGNSG